MKKNQNELKTTLFVLGASVASALLIAILLIYFYGPSGTYLAGNTLLNPTMIAQMNLSNQRTKKERASQFAIERVTFSFFDKSVGRAIQKPISLSQYEKFYAMVERENSLSTPKDIQKVFNKIFPTLLTVQIRAAGKSTETGQVFQEVQFIEDDYFRVQLKTSESKAEWAYYYRPHLYSEVFNLFNPATE